ncbi:16865_t:CDS:2 [Funneliformis caledonium]|uniref:16865_t:CDS:1 n=1 Tax=Funneliformis caledonium TaxID=1117310 RepID=A0A9N9EC41_9GLOM|nr:16865_t:CDS:2 [Funneliformis caledonium]
MFEALNYNVTEKQFKSNHIWKSDHVTRQHLIEPEELEDELVEEPCELVSDSLVELASDSLDPLC